MKHAADLRFLAPWLAFAAAVFAPVNSALAYVGPGLGAGAIAVVLGVIGSVLLAMFAILWYPVKRLLKKQRRVAAQPGDGQSPEATD